MRVVSCPTPDEVGKFRGVIRAFPSIWMGQVLDVGCRSGLLREALKQEGVDAAYTGLDLYLPADIIADLGKGLPFSDKSFDVVVALDVLEHVDDIHFALAELCRVSKRWVVITLPNAYELRGRVKFLLGRPLSGKYGLPPEPPKDRHRWIFSLADARKFLYTGGKKYEFAVREEGCLAGPRRFRWLRYFMSRWPNLFCPTYLCLLERQGEV